jgi:diacylglycerol kinase (ATP)
MKQAIKHKIILNPVAGKGAAEKALPVIEDLCRRHGIDYLLERTRRPWHAAELTLQAVEEGCDVVVAAGGDGTSNEVLNGLMLAKEKLGRTAALGILCAGRGNDFAYGVGIPKDLDAGCRALAAGRRGWMDVGKVSGGLYPEGRYFGNGIGVGFDTIVGFEAAKFKRLSGLPVYLIAALKTLFLYYKAPLMRLEYNGRSIEEKLIQISVMNGRRMGGLFMMAPGAEPDDGLFDLCYVNEISQTRMIGVMARYIKGTQAESPAVTTGRAPQLHIEALEGTLAVHADGETIAEEGRRLRVECLQRQIEVVSAAGGEKAGS